MDQPSVENLLADLPVPAIRYFDTIDSTNDEAWRWVTDSAPDHALIIADEQTAGKGRLNRRWITHAGTGLAFSLVLLAPPVGAPRLSCLTGLGALATCQALHLKYNLPAQIKWPNDILLNQRKVGGVLVEARWHGDDLRAVVIGIGINIAPGSLRPDILAENGLSIPATCLENALGHPVDRMEVLHDVLHELFRWLFVLASPSFMRAWEDDLAYRDQWVELSTADAAQPSQDGAPQSPAILGKLIGLDQDGSLILQTDSGKLVMAQVGEIRLRPANAPTTG